VGNELNFNGMLGREVSLSRPITFPPLGCVENDK